MTRRMEETVEIIHSLIELVTKENYIDLRATRNGLFFIFHRGFNTLIIIFDIFSRIKYSNLLARSTHRKLLYHEHDWD